MEDKEAETLTLDAASRPGLLSEGLSLAAETSSF